MHIHILRDFFHVDRASPKIPLRGMLKFCKKTQRINHEKKNLSRYSLPSYNRKDALDKNKVEVNFQRTKIISTI